MPNGYRQRQAPSLREVRRRAGRPGMNPAPGLGVLLTFLLLTNLLAASPAAGAEPAAPTRLKLQLQQEIHFRSAGYYAAQELGYFRQEGLEVEIAPGGPGADPLPQVLKRQADIGVGDTSLLLSYAEGQPVVVLAALFQRSPYAIVVREGSGFQRLKDLAGKRVLITPSRLLPELALFREAGVPPELLQIVPFSGDTSGLVTGQIAAVCLDVTTELPALSAHGLRLRVLPGEDEAGQYGYGDCLFAGRWLVQERPQAVEAFLQAARRGWLHALRNPQQTVQWLRTKYGSRLSEDLLMQEAQAVRELVMPELMEPGQMNLRRWEEIARAYSAGGALPASLPLEDFIYNPVQQRERQLGAYLAGGGLAAAGVGALFLALVWYNRRLQRQVRGRTRELQENQKRLEMALEGSGDGIWDWDTATDRLYFNPHWIRAVGYDESTFPNTFRSLISLLHPDDRELAMHSAETLLHSQEGTFELECRIRTGAGGWRWMLLRGRVQEDGRVAGTNVDITDKKTAAQELQNRLHALISPDHNAVDLTFNEIFDLTSIQALQDSFAEAFGVSSLIIAPDGRPLTQPTGFTRLCAQVVRASDGGQALCAKTSQRLSLGRRNEPALVTCQACGLLDGGAGIYAGDKHLANWMVGQVLPHEYSEEEQTAFAVRCGADPAEYRHALTEVPRMSRERFAKVTVLLNLFARQLSQLAWQNVAQGRVIHDLNAAEQKLLENEAVLKEAQAIAHVGHWNYRVQENVFDCSEEARRILGLARTGRLELSALRQALHEDDRGLFDRLWQQSLASGEALKANLRVLVSGAVRHLYLRGVVLGGANGKPEYLLGILQDITERVEREKALREQEENLRITLDSIADGVIAADYAGRITRMNPVAQQLTGWNIMEARGQPLKDIFRTADPATREPCASPVECVLQDGIQSGLPVELLLLPRDEAARTISCSASPIRNERGILVGAVLVLRDMTGQHQLEEQLRQAQKLEAIGQLAGGVAHDFNNLLGGIMGFAELVKLGSAGSERNEHYATQIMVTAERAAQLTSQLLTFARKGQLPSTRFDAHEIINEAVNILRHSIDRRIDILLEFKAVKHLLTGDPVQIQNAVLNLGINARDAMPEGGKLEIITSDIRLMREYCEASAFKLEPGDYLLLTVRDNGAGICPEHLPRIFDPFFTTKQVGKGTGLGLAAVFGTVTAHGGAIDVKSTLGEGTEFRIYLPAEDADDDKPQTKISDRLLRSGNGRTLLVIDDEPIIRSMAENLLGEAGFRILTAENGQSGTELYRAHQTEVAAVIVDMVMPVMDGLQTMQELRKLNPKVLVIAASGFSQNERIDQMLAAGAKDFIHKPYNLQEILRKVHTLLDAAPGSTLDTDAKP